MTASTLVDEWSGTLAQINVQRNLVEIAGAPDIPTLADVTRAFNNATAVRLIARHLQSLCEFGDTTVKKNQFVDTALLIATEYYYLNLSELCLFFRRCKMGHYGQLVWGQRLNIQQVTTALYRFIAERMEVIGARESKAHEVEIEASSYEEQNLCLHGGIDELHELQAAARTDYAAFRQLFPQLPSKDDPQAYWEAWKQNEEEVGRYLCHFCCKHRSQSP